MNEQLKFINQMIDQKIEYYQQKMAIAKDNIKYHKSMTIIQDSANTVAECAVVLETLSFIKEVCAQSVHLNMKPSLIKEIDKESRDLYDDLDL